MKNIQEWLGHANFNTTADVYSHLDYSSKLESASVIANQLSNSSIEEKDVEELELEVKRLNELIALKKSLTSKKSKERNRDGQVQT